MNCCQHRPRDRVVVAEPTQRFAFACLSACLCRRFNAPNLPRLRRQRSPSRPSAPPRGLAATGFNGDSPISAAVAAAQATPLWQHRRTSARTGPVLHASWLMVVHSCLRLCGAWPLQTRDIASHVPAPSGAQRVRAGHPPMCLLLAICFRPDLTRVPYAFPRQLPAAGH